MKIIESGSDFTDRFFVKGTFMKKRIFSMLLASCFLLITCSGCGDTSESSTANTEAATTAETVETAETVQVVQVLRCSELLPVS